MSFEFKIPFQILVRMLLPPRINQSKRLLFKSAPCAMQVFWQSAPYPLRQPKHATCQFIHGSSALKIASEFSRIVSMKLRSQLCCHQWVESGEEILQTAVEKLNTKMDHSGAGKVPSILCTHRSRQTGAG